MKGTAPGKSPNVSLRLSPRQVNKPEVAKSNGYNGVAGVDIRGFNPTVYKCVYICVIIDRIQNVQHLLRDVDPVDVAGLEVTFRRHEVEC